MGDSYEQIHNEIRMNVFCVKDNELHTQITEILIHRLDNSHEYFPFSFAKNIQQASSAQSVLILCEFELICYWICRLMRLNPKWYCIEYRPNFAQTKV